MVMVASTQAMLVTHMMARRQVRSSPAAATAASLSLPSLEARPARAEGFAACSGSARDTDGSGTATDGAGNTRVWEGTYYR